MPEEFPPNRLVIGGHEANKQTDILLKEFCPEFVAHKEGGDGVDRSHIWYSAHDEVFDDTETAAWSFIVVLGQDVTGRRVKVILLFGRTSFGTAMAVRLLA